MFHWICPECGQEIAPGVKECPVCEPQASALSLPSGGLPVTAAPVTELPAPAASAPLVEELAPPVLQRTEQPAPDAVQRSIVEQPIQEPQVVLQREVLLPSEAILQAKTFHGAKPPVILEAIPADVRPVVMPDVPLATSPVELPDPLMDGSDGSDASVRSPEPETFADRLADLAYLLHGEHIPYAAPRIFQESAAPGPHLGGAEQPAGRTPKILDVTFHEEVTPKGTPPRMLLAAPPSRLLLAEPQPPSVASVVPIEAIDPRPLSAVQSLEPREAEPTVAATVQLPEARHSAAAPALAPLQDYSATADRLMRPVEHSPRTPSSTALPTVTLAGPALPRELMSLQAAGLVPIRTGGRRARVSSGYGWLMKYVVVGMLLTAGVATYSMMPGSSTSARPRPTPTPEPAPEPPISVQSTRSTNSLARLVEVTGVRFMEVNKKPQIHYLVVSHSSAPLASVTVYVTLHATTAKPGQPPIAKLTFRSPALAAFEAKEMFSSIERSTAAVDLPDWQDLRADVDVQ